MSWLNESRNAIQWGNNLKSDLLKSKHLGYLLLLAMIVTVLVGFMLFLIDPNIDSPFDGIWSAWGTMTHVGFGDVVPTSFFGRLLAAALILFGLVFFSLFTALVSVTLIGKNIDALGTDVLRIENEATTIQSEENKILAELARLHERMDGLERMILSQQSMQSK
jgi:voltage-gated potassium channel